MINETRIQKHIERLAEKYARKNEPFGVEQNIAKAAYETAAEELRPLFELLGRMNEAMGWELSDKYIQEKRIEIEKILEGK